MYLAVSLSRAIVFVFLTTEKENLFPVSNFLLQDILFFLLSDSHPYVSKFCDRYKGIPL